MQENILNHGADKRIDEFLSVLDIDADIPDGLIEKVVGNVAPAEFPVRERFDFSKYLQIAAVLAAAVFVGVLLGRNADANTFRKKHKYEQQALIELCEKHHLCEKNSFGKF